MTSGPVVDYDVIYDEGGSIGRRYARADEVGVPFCITVDRETLSAGTVTIRERDSKAQVKVQTGELSAWLRTNLSASPGSPYSASRSIR